MIKMGYIPSVLIAEDDRDDRLLMEEGFRENEYTNTLIFVNDGEELIDYLLRQGNYKLRGEALPDLIFLDLNLPKKDGRECLKMIKKHPVIKRLPVIVFSTSNSHLDVKECYELGANCYLSKPQTFKELTEMLRKIGDFWFNNVEYSPKADV